MRALVTGMGRSGSLWTATALRECCGVDARHESVRQIEDIDHVEVNTKLVLSVPEDYRDIVEGLVLVHLVRDGRDVVSSVLDRHPKYGFKEACYAWAVRNSYILDLVPDDRRFQLEHLVQSGFEMDAFSHKLGGYLSIQLWEDMRERRINAGDHGYPYWREWGTMQTNAFWEICGETMDNCGYKKEGEDDE